MDSVGVVIGEVKAKEVDLGGVDFRFGERNITTVGKANSTFAARYDVGEAKVNGVVSRNDASNKEKKFSSLSLEKKKKLLIKKKERSDNESRRIWEKEKCVFVFLDFRVVIIKKGEIVEANFIAS